MVLTATLVNNVCLDSKPHHGELFNREVLGADSSDDRKALAVVQLVANPGKLGGQRGKGKVLNIDQVAVEFQGWRGALGYVLFQNGM